MKMSENANYGNWVSAAMMKMLWTATAVLCAITVLLFVVMNVPIPGVIGLIVTAAALCMTLYMQRCRKLFDFRGGCSLELCSQNLSERPADRHGLLGRGMELCQRAV